MECVYRRIGKRKRECREARASAASLKNQCTLHVVTQPNPTQPLETHRPTNITQLHGGIGKFWRHLGFL